MFTNILGRHIKKNNSIDGFVAAILDENNDTLRTIALNCSKIAHGETSEETINALMEIIEEGKDYLIRWAKIHMNNYPN